jgi:protocatechuate 3,4-dioxygenase beta subunit
VDLVLARREIGWLRAIGVALLVMLAFGGIPGSRVRSLAPPPVTNVEAQVGVLDVLVHDGAGGPALAGARVRVLAVLDDRVLPAREAVTDAQGHAHLATIPRGPAWILADAPGRARGSAHGVVGVAARTVSIDLVPGHSLRVAARDEAGVPLPGIDVEALSAVDPLPLGARTGADGTVFVDRLGVGPWVVTARGPGFDDTTARADREGQLVTIVLRKLGAVRVHVLLPDGSDASGARVTIAGASLWPARSVESDAHGEIRVGSLGAGAYALRATRGDSVSPIEPAVTVDRGEDTRVVLRLGPGHYVRVRVTAGNDEDADPIGRARVTLAEGGLSPFPLEASTDASGRARVGPIGPGPASVSAFAEGFVPQGAVSVADPPPAETRIALARAGVLTGRVVDGRGDPIDGATIEIAGTNAMGGPILDDPRRSSFQVAHFDAMLAGPSPLVSGELGVVPGPVPPIPAAGIYAMLPPDRALAGGDPWVTAGDGTFRAAPASPGRVRAIVHHPQYVEAESDVVTLAPGGEAHVDVVMLRGGTLDGRLLDDRDRPVAGARVFASATRGMLERTTHTASDGTFAFAALPDKVTLSAGRDDDETPEVRLAVEIPEGESQEVTLHLPAPRDPLGVRVVDERGDGIGAVQVSAQSLSAGAPLRVTAFTDNRGQASLKRAAGLPLHVEVTAPSRAPRELVTDGSPGELRVELRPAETLVGQVVGARGRDPISGAEVTLHLDSGARRTRTDAAGSFSFRDLAAGDARLAIHAVGFAPVERAVTIADTGGRRASAIDRVELAEEGVVEGDVVDTRGNPVAGARVAEGHAPTWLLVGTTPSDVAVTDATGRFTLRGLPEGNVTLEAYAPDLGRGYASTVNVVSARTTDRIHIVIERDVLDGGEPLASGGVAVTLGERGSPAEVVVVSVAEGSEAERAGLAAGDVVLAVDAVLVSTIEEAREKLAGPIAEDVMLRLRREGRVVEIVVARDAVRR